MKASRRSLPLVLSCLFAAATTSAIAGGSQSLLDPYAHISAPEGKKSAKSALPASEDPNAVQSTATYVTMPFDNNADGSAKKGLLPGIPGKGLLSGLTKPMKALKKDNSSVASSTSATTSSKPAGGAGAKIAGSGKWMADGMANSGKKMKEGLASTGGVFAKGAKAIGDGFIATGSKMKEGTQAVGSKIAGLPSALKRDNTNSAGTAAKSAPQVAAKPKTQSSGSKLAFLSKIKLKKGGSQPAAVAKAPATNHVAVKEELNLTEKPQVAGVDTGTQATDDLGASPVPVVTQVTQPVVERTTQQIPNAVPIQQKGNKVTAIASHTTKKIAAAPSAMKHHITKLFKRGKGNAQEPTPQATASKTPAASQL